MPPYHVYDASAPTSACVPLMLLPAKSLSKSPCTASTSSLNENLHLQQEVLNINVDPGYRNPAYQDENQGSPSSYRQRHVQPPVHIVPSHPEHSELTSPSRSLPKHIIQISTTMDGVFDSKESADSGISKGSMIHQSSNEDREDSYSDGSPHNQADLMKGRSLLDATARRNIFYQESIKNRTKLADFAADDDKNRAAENNTHTVIVHRSSTPCEDLAIKGQLDTSRSNSPICYNPS